MSLFTKNKKVKVMRSDFSKIFDPVKLMQYISNGIAKGSKYSLFKDPNITTSFYDVGTGAWESIELASTDYTNSVNGGNVKTVSNAIIAGKKWLNAYADQVEEI